MRKRLFPGGRSAVFIAVAIATGLLVFAAAGFGGSGKPAAQLELGAPVIVDQGKVSTPTLATGPAGRVYIAWTRDSKRPGPYGGLLGIGYVTHSDTGGRTFSAPVRVGKQDNIQSPQVLAITPKGTVLDAWASYTPAPKQFPEGGYVYWLARSTNGGRSFTDATVTDGGVQSVSRPNLMVDSKGLVWATWLDGRPLDRTSSDPLFTVNVALSRADGLGFTPSWVVKGNACQCCRPGIAERPGHSSTLAMIWRDVVQKPGTENHGMQMDGMDPNGKSDPKKVYPKTDIRNVKVSVSTDAGHDFGTSHSVNDFNWHIQACPTIGPTVWYSADGSKLRVAWFTGALGHLGVYYSESSDGGVRFSAPIKLTGDLVGEGYDLATTTGPNGSSYVGWATPDSHVQAARIDASGAVHWTPKLRGDRVALTSLKNGTVLLSYVDRGKLVVRSVHS